MRSRAFHRPTILATPAALVVLVIVGCGPPQPIAEDSNSAMENAVAAEPKDGQPSEVPGTNDPSEAPAAQNGAETPADDAPAADAENEGVTLREIPPKEFPQVLEKYRGRVVLVDFWATWCIPCREKFPETAALSRQYAGDGLVVLSMNLDDPEGRQAAVRFLESQDAPFEHLVSSEGGSDESFEAFAIDGGALPHFKLYDRQGALRHTFSNSDPLAERQFTHADIERRVKELLAESSS